MLVRGSIYFLALILLGLAAWSGIQFMVVSQMAIDFGNSAYSTCGWISGHCDPELVQLGNGLLFAIVVSLIGAVLLMFRAASLDTQRRI